MPRPSSIPRKPVKPRPSAADKAEAEATLGDSGTALWRDVAAVNEELFAFGRQRLQANLARNDTLLQCRDLEDVYRLQSDFASSTAQQYIEESGRLMSLMTRLALDCCSPTNTMIGLAGRAQRSAAAPRPQD